MRIDIVKPDWGISGGFEVVVDQVVRDLLAAGHEVVRRDVQVRELPRRAFGVAVADSQWAHSPEWFTHLAMLEAFRSLDVSGADVVLSTQPPSYAVDHPRQLALFYHHARAFYDLEDVWVAAGRAPADLHHAASALLRSAEAEDIAGVTRFLAGSQRVIERLHEFHGDDLAISLYQSPGRESTAVAPGGEPRHVVTISRHEFTKRTELTVQALALGSVPGHLVGGGGRLEFVRQLAARAATAGDAASWTDVDTWLNLGEAAPEPTAVRHPRVTVHGRVSDDELDTLLSDALCIVAPAYDEDDGLSVLEAMRLGIPVIVCKDGGGLAAHVRDGENGFVVEPTGQAIAAAIGRLRDDPDLRAQMRLAALETSSERSASKARAQLLGALEQVASGGAA